MKSTSQNYVKKKVEQKESKTMPANYLLLATVQT